MTFTHHIIISVGALTPKLNPSAFQPWWISKRQHRLLKQIVISSSGVSFHFWVSWSFVAGKCLYALYIAVDFVNTCQGISRSCPAYAASRPAPCYTEHQRYIHVLPTIVLRPAPCYTEHRRNIHVLPTVVLRPAPCYTEHQRNIHVPPLCCIKACPRV